MCHILTRLVRRNSLRRCCPLVRIPRRKIPPLTRLDVIVPHRISTAHTTAGVQQHNYQIPASHRHGVAARWIVLRDFAALEHAGGDRRGALVLFSGELESLGQRVEFRQGVLEQRARGSSYADIARLDCRK